MKEHGFFKVAAAIPELRVADCKFNTLQIKKILKKADKLGVQMVCFPELCITGYTCGDLFFQKALVRESENAIIKLLKETENLSVYFIVGAPVEYKGKIYNAAVVCGAGQIFGIIPKSYLPNYSEFYEKRWFTPFKSDSTILIEYAEDSVHFGTNLLFGIEERSFAVEICEDLWATIPPSCKHVKAGAKLIFNLSASNELIGKRDYVKSLVKQQSARCLAGYVYASAGWGESTTDVVYAGNAFICENGHLLAESEKFQFEEQLIISDIDFDLLDTERKKNTSFEDDFTSSGYQCIYIDMFDGEGSLELTRKFSPHPFIPSEESYNESCEDIFSIQIGGLAKRLIHTQAKTAVIGISGGLDSTLALLVCAKTFEKLKLSKKQIVGVTMPGFGTTDRTYSNALKLMQSLGITIREINIEAACNQHFKDISHDPAIHDVTFENTQARERTQILMNIANQTNGLVIGTGDMSELALGWATYNGDHMSMYGVNSGIPKTLVRHLVKWVAESQMDKTSRTTLLDILDTPVSPELIPCEANGQSTQCTEDIVGPYELHDFFLYYTLRQGFTPEKIFFLAKQAFQNLYDAKTILRWMEVFFRRFFSQQFKRSCMPDGPKVGSVNLSPRGDWRMPSDASAGIWLEEIKKLSKNA